MASTRDAVYVFLLFVPVFWLASWVLGIGFWPVLVIGGVPPLIWNATRPLRQHRRQNRRRAPSDQNTGAAT